MSGPHLGRPSIADDLTAPSEPSPTSHLEIETKLEADPDFRLPDLAGLAGLPEGARVGEPTVLHLRATYFDTRRLELVGSKVTLRRREGGVDDGWHLKLPSGAGARREIGVPLRPPGASDEDPTPPESLASLVAGLARGRTLLPVAQFSTTRTVRRVLHPDGTALVEIADDAVTAVRLLPGEVSEPQQWREVEVEVIDGTPEVMATVSGALIAAGARPSGSASKLARALGVDGTPTTPGQDPATSGDVVLAALRTYRQQLLTADVGLRFPDPKAEALHDARAAARRIRSVLQVYETLFLAGSLDRLTGRLRKLGRIIGATRDLDVVAERLVSVLDGSPDLPESGELAAELGRRVAQHRADRLTALHERLSGKGYRSTLRALDDVIDDPPSTTLAASPAGEALPPLLTAAWYRLRALAEAALADPDTPTKAHEVRKAAKTVRYAAEAAAAALGTGVAEFAGFAEDVQEILGQHQDAITTISDVRSGDERLPVSILPVDVVERIVAAENAEAGRTFDEFMTLWAGRPSRP